MKRITEGHEFLGPVSFKQLPKEYVSTLVGTEPSVENARVFVCSYTVISITRFVGGSEGQSINILGDGTTTIVHDPALINTTTTADRLLVADVIYRFTCINGVWYEDYDEAGAGITLHAVDHQNGGVDEINVAGLSGVLADPQPPIIGGGAAQAVAGNDARLTDSRDPLPHVTDHQNGGTDELVVTGLSGVLADAQIADTLKESSGPTNLVIGAIANSEYLVRSGATIIGGTPTAVVDIKTVEVDFGLTPLSEKVVSIADAAVTGGQIIMTQSYDAATGREADENEFATLHCIAGQAVAGVGFSAFIRCVNGLRELQGIFKFNYMLG